MKITKSYLRKLIKETIQEGWENEIAWIVTMRNSETGKTEKVHVWTGAPNEKEAKRIARTSSKYAGDSDWEAVKAEQKDQPGSLSHDEENIQKIVSDYLENYRGDAAKAVSFAKSDNYEDKIDFILGHLRTRWGDQPWRIRHAAAEKIVAKSEPGS
tara:strand:+ start:3881 stop:4348 length:468 start_codon:yes stop_codon:yes gene_type:complete